MCYNQSSTACFSILYAISMFIYYKYKFKHYKLLILFNGFFMVMEMYQFIMWTYGDLTVDHGTCNNEFLTYGAYILIWLQPLLFSYIGSVAFPMNITFKELNKIFIIIFIISLITIYYGTEGITCSHIGPNGYLEWSFKSRLRELQPNYLLYFMMCIISFSFYEFSLYNIPISWMISFLVTVSFSTVNIGELPSRWCYLSVISIPINLFFSYVTN